MKPANSILATAILMATVAVGPAFAQGKPQTLTVVKIDPQALATGYRTTKIVGSSVVNDSNETIGTISDLIVTHDDKGPFAVLSIGGFLGVGSHYVVVPFSQFQVRDNQMVLPGATKDSLKSLPVFNYNT